MIRHRLLGLRRTPVNDLLIGAYQAPLPTSRKPPEPLEAIFFNETAKSYRRANNPQAEPKTEIFKNSSNKRQTNLGAPRWEIFQSHSLPA